MKVSYDRILRYYLILDRKCNMNCIYCIQDDGAKQLPKTFYFPSPEHVAKYFPQNNMLYEVIFYGGEAFIYFDYMIEIARCIKERNENVRFAVTTNGTLLTVERAKILNELEFRVNLSHDAHVYETTRRRQDFLKVNPEPVLLLNNFVFISTITKYNWDYYKVWDYFENFYIKHGIKRHKVNMMFLKDCFGHTDKNLFIYKNKDFEKMLDKVFYNLKIHILNNNFESYEFMCYENLLGRILKENLYHNSKSFCMFFDTAMAIDVYGNIYDCHNDVSPYGHLTDKELNEYENPYLSQEPCRNCNIKGVCAGGCVKASDDRRKFICYYMKHEIGRMIKMLNEIVEEKNKVIK